MAKGSLNGARNWLRSSYPADAAPAVAAAPPRLLTCAHLAQGEVERFDWPGLRGLNFLLHQALGGGGVASLRYDPQGKAHAQLWLDMPVDVPRSWLPPSFEGNPHG